MKRAKAIMWGIAFVLLGIILGINALDLFQMNIFFDGWWTLLIIVPCFIGVFTDRDKTGNLIGIALGVFLLLCSQKILSFELVLKLLFPLIIVLIGLKMIFSSFKSGKSAKIMRDVAESGAKVHAVSAVFCSENIIYHGEEFTSADLNAVFGKVTYDLRTAYIPKDCVIKTSAVFGSINLLLPANVNVKTNTTSIFGGVSDKDHDNSKANTVTVYIEGMTLFGGVDIK